jgi:hypothetical protein
VVAQQQRARTPLPRSGLNAGPDTHFQPLDTS